jgi:hypothetical protein
LKLSVARVAEEWKVFGGAGLDSSIGTRIGAEITTCTFIFVHSQIPIPGERTFGANFDALLRLTGNT